jgi:DNA polymerase sigma
MNGKNNLGRLLLDFFNFFGNILDYNTTEIAPAKANDKVEYPFPPKKGFLEYYTTTSLVINDPLTVVNNVARPTFKFFILRVSFLLFLMVLDDF